MVEKTKLYVLKEKAVPDVLLRVMEAKKLLDSGKCPSVQEATDRVGISRSSFYKYKDDIFPFHENGRGKTINMVIQMEDEQGILSQVLSAVAANRANILTIHQSVPINGMATLSISADIPSEDMDLAKMVAAIEAIDGIMYAKILARE